MKRILLLLVSVFSLGLAFGQTLSLGDLAIIGLSVDDEEALIVALEAIPSGESVFFTDDEWGGTSFNSGEGFYEWVTPAISAGTVFTIATSGTSVGGTVTSRAGSFALSNSGDGFYIYQTSTNVYNTGTYTVLGFAGEDAGDAGTLTGTGLTLGTNAIYYGGDNGIYTGTRVGQDAATYLSLIYGSSWATSGSSQTFVMTDFTFVSAGCTITSLDLTSVSCSDNSTSVNTTDDIITFDLNPTGSTLGTNYDITVSSGTVSPTTAVYGSATTFTMQTGSAGAGDFTVTITDQTTGTCTENTFLTDPGACSVAPCATPSTQASNLVLSNITASSIDGSFTATTADNYLVVQSTSVTLGSNPVDATTYAISDAIGSGIVIFNGSGTSFIASGLTASTQYYYFVFAYNDAACSGGPLYLTPALVDDETTVAGPSCNIFDDFNRTNTSVIANGWTEVGGNASIVSNELILGTGGSSGIDYLYTDVSSSYNSVLSNLTAQITWEFNMRQSRTNPSGLASGNYGVAFALGGTVSDFTNGNGYAVVHGNSGSTDNVRLVRFNGGIDGALTDIVSDGTDYGNNHFSIRVTYNPANDEWELFVRNDGSSFTDPSTLTAANSSGTQINSTYVNDPLDFVGPYWAHATGASEEGQFDNICISAVSAPEIEIQGNLTEIVDADNTPDLGDDTDFGATALLGGTVVKTFTILNTGGADLTVSGVASSNATIFAIAGIITPATITPSDSTTFTVTFDPAVLGTSTATITVNSDDADEAVYTFDITGEGVNSNTSDIIESAGFTYTSNIDYTAFQATGPLTGASGSVGVFRFEIRDGGGVADTDALGTELTDITFNLGSTHAAYIRDAALFDVTAMRNNTPTINVGAGTITFSGLSGANFTAADDASLTLTLRVSFLTNVDDNEQLQFTISSATANTSGSVFATANAGGAVSSIIGNRNRLEVTATQLTFTVQPTDANISGTMAPAVEVSGTDVNENVDLDYTSSVDITSTGTLTGTTVSATAVAGLASFSGLVHTADGTGFTLSAVDGSLTGATSAPFDISTLPFVNGDYRTTGSGIWLNNNATPAIWEELVAGVWTASNSPSYNTSNKVFIRDGHTITTGGSYGTNVDIYVLDGGIFNNNHPSTAGDLIIYDGGNFNVNTTFSINSSGTLEVQDNGTLLINNQYGNPETSLWNGTEIFHPNSNFVLRNWDGADDVLLEDNTSITTNTYSGYTAAFGNIICDFESNLGGSDDMIFLESGITINLAHGDLIFKTNDGGGASMRISTVGNVSSGIGGDFIVEDTYLATQVINIKTSSTLNFTIEGDMELNSATTRIATGTNTNSTVNINGDLRITPSAVLDFNPSVAGGATAIINLNGDLFVAGSGLLQNSNTSNLGEFNFTGTGDGFTAATTQTIDIASTSSNENRNIDFNVQSGAYVEQINRDFELGRNSSLNIKDGGTYNFGFDGTTALNVTISGSQSGTVFDLDQGGRLYITNPDGINETGNLGNVQTVASNRVFSSVAFFHYIGKQNQVTGDAITSSSSSAKHVFVDLIDDNTTLTPSDSVGISNTATLGSPGKLHISTGIVIGTDLADFRGTGNLVMDGGWYREYVTTPISIAPQLTGAYTLTAGTVELIATDDQTLRGGKDYFNLEISGSNVNGVDDKTVTSAFTVANQLTITGTPIFDIENRTMTGAAGITQDGGLLRMSKLSTSLPELDGTATTYSLTGGTIEWYGTNATQTHNIRSRDDNSDPIAYNNIEVNAAVANLTTGGFNVGLVGNTIVNGTMNVNSPAVFQTDENDHLDGAGIFNLNAGATYHYADEFGITLGTATAINAGAIRLSTARVASNFSTDASYGFVGSGAMVSGDALPASCLNLYTRKTTATDEITLTNPLEVNGDLNLETGVLVSTNSELLSISNSATATGASDNSYVSGPCRKIGTDAFEFPVGKAGNYQAIGISPPLVATDHFTAEYFQADPHPTYNENSKDGTIDHISSCEYWILDRTNGTSPVFVGLTWDANSCGVTNVNELLVTRWDGTTWKDQGNGGTIGTSVAGNIVTMAPVTTFSPFTLASSTSANPLPVELLFFEAENKAENVLVSWATATEINNDFFTIERSKNGLNFEAIGELSGAGNYSGKLDYQLLDKSPLEGISYYRLKQTDFDGSFEYSKTVSVNRNEQNNFSVDVYPNPTSNFLNLVRNSVIDETLSIDIYDVTGRKVQAYNSSNLASENFIKLDVSNLIPGTYYVKYNTVLNQKIISFIKK